MNARRFSKRVGADLMAAEQTLNAGVVLIDSTAAPSMRL
jgi:hypothetical protein